MDYESIFMKKNRISRSISAENKTGEKNNGAKAIDGPGAVYAKRLGVGWKIEPCVEIEGNSIQEIADIDGPGIIKSIWMTHGGISRFLIIRIYWNHQHNASVEMPLGDFFANALGKYYQNNSLMVNINPGRGFNCFWPMPFHKHCRITIENINDEKATLYYQINYELGEIEPEALYFHGYFNRSNPLPYKEVHTILPLIEGAGHYVGTYLLWQVNNNQWWGEGEIKFYIDDDEYPTICGTGTEDYFGGAWNFENPVTKKYESYSGLYMGFHQFIPDGTYQANTKFNMYRWHIQDLIIFNKNLKVTIQALGWRNGFKEYLPLKDDISSVCFWYQSLKEEKLLVKLEKDEIEII